MAEVLANGLRFHVQRRPPPGGAAGPAPTVVFVHGLGADNLTSLYFALGGAVNAAGAEVVFYDLRGHGRSERPRDGYRLRDASADLAALLAALDLGGPVHLVGSSYGGMVALAHALARPEGVASLVLVDPQILVEGLPDLLTGGLAAFAGAFDDDGVREALGRLPRGRSRLARQAEALLLKTTLCEDLLTTEPVRAAELRSVGCPVLCVNGGASDLVVVARELERLVPDCTVEVLPGRTHLLLREAPDEVRRVVVAWLAARAWPARAAGRVDR